DAASAKIKRLASDALDFAAYSIAARVLTENGDQDLVSGLSITRCRQLFDAAKPEVRMSLLATFLGAPPAALVDAARLGDNLMRAMLATGLEAHHEDYQAFRDRKRN